MTTSSNHYDAKTAGMGDERIGCVLLADRHHALSEGVRNLLKSTFKVVIMVADEVSLFESAKQMPAALAVVDLSLTRGEGIELVRRLRNLCPELKVLAVSVHDEPRVSQLALEAGANGFVLKRTLATDLLSAVDMVLKGQRYVSPTVVRHH